MKTIKNSDNSNRKISMKITTSSKLHKTNFGLIVPPFLLLLILVLQSPVTKSQNLFSSVTTNGNGNGDGDGGGSEEWDGSVGRSASGFTCINIPSNFSLCKNIGYSKMMIPNLLGHDSLQEAEYHASTWVPLLGLQCHPDTQLFLCSLFSPICLDRPIYPCRSLCLGVQAKCEPRMLAYNYPWPNMLRCDLFPEDHDLCIKPGAANKTEDSEEVDCPACNQAHTCENIVDNYCRADFVFRAKFKRNRGPSLEFRKGRWFKRRESGRRSREFRFLVDPKDKCCSGKLRPGQPYFVMGIWRGDQRIVTFIKPWNGKDKIMKNAVKTFRSMDCSNPLPMSVISSSSTSGVEVEEAQVGRRKRSRRRQGQEARRHKGGRNGRQNQNSMEGCRSSPSANQ